MEDNKDDLYITKTDLLSCEDVVAYLWKKCDKFSSPFKPEGSFSIDDKVSFSDSKEGEEIKKEYEISGEDIRHMSLKNHQTYDVDNIEFVTYDEAKRPLTSGNLVVIYRPIEKFYYVMLQENKHLSLLVKCVQKKKLFGSFPTETVTFF